MDTVYHLSYNCMGGEHHQHVYSTLERAMDAAFYHGQYYTQMPDNDVPTIAQLEWNHFGQLWMVTNIQQNDHFANIYIERMVVNGQNIGNVHLNHKVVDTD